MPTPGAWRADNVAVMRRRVLWGTGALLAAAGVAALAVFGLAGSSSAERPAPALPREVLVGPPATLASLLAGARGKPALVVFWASWCTPCGEEAPAIERFAASPAGQGRIVGVDWSDARAGARTFVKRYAWTFPNLRDGEGRAGYAYRLVNLPTTLVISPAGRIRRVLRGPQDEASLTRALAG